MHELEEGFFKHVAEDAEQLTIIKKRGDGSGVAAISHPEKPKEEVKAPVAEQKPAAPQQHAAPVKPVGIVLPVGQHVFKGALHQDGGAEQHLEFVFHVVEGGIISSPATEAVKYSLNGIVQDGKLTLKQQFEGEGAGVDAEFDGEFDSANTIKGTYKGENGATHPFELKKQ